MIKQITEHYLGKLKEEIDYADRIIYHQLIAVSRIHYSGSLMEETSKVICNVSGDEDGDLSFTNIRFLNEEGIVIFNKSAGYRFGTSWSHSWERSVFGDVLGEEFEWNDYVLWDRNYNAKINQLLNLMTDINTILSEKSESNG